MPLPTDVKYFTSEIANIQQLGNNTTSLVPLLRSCLIDGFGEVSVSNLTVSGNVATATAAGHTFIKYAVVLIAGSSNPLLNGEHRVTSVSGDTFTFETVGVSDGPASGAITAKYAPAGWKVVGSPSTSQMKIRTAKDDALFVLTVGETKSTTTVGILETEETNPTIYHHPNHIHQKSSWRLLANGEKIALLVKNNDSYEGYSPAIYAGLYDSTVPNLKANGFLQKSQHTSPTTIYSGNHSQFPFNNEIILTREPLSPFPQSILTRFRNYSGSGSFPNPNNYSATLYTNDLFISGSYVGSVNGFYHCNENHKVEEAIYTNVEGVVGGVVAYFTISSSSQSIPIAFNLCTWK